jgi:hypothetical protein
MLVEYASAYATIVGLLSAFSSGRDAKNKDIQHFIEWLSNHNHQELAEEIQKNQKTTIFVKAFLNKEIPEIQLKLDSIIALVQALVERLQESPETPVEQRLSHHYSQRIIIFLFEQFKEEKISMKNFQYALEETQQIIHGHLSDYNPYVLEAMVRECLSTRDTATEVVHKHWHNLI